MYSLTFFPLIFAENRPSKIMNIKNYVKEKQKLFKLLDSAIDKILSDDAEERKEGRQELEKLRSKDKSVPYFIGYAHEIGYEYTGNQKDAQQAIKEYKRIIDDGYAFLEEKIQEL